MVKLIPFVLLNDWKHFWLNIKQDMCVHFLEPIYFNYSQRGSECSRETQEQGISYK